MTMPSQTVLLRTLALASMAVLAIHPARADDCKRFAALQYPISSPCQLNIDRCGRKLDAAATAAYGLWKKSNYVAEPKACSPTSPINCSAYYCKVLIRRPQGLTPRG